MGFLGTSVGGGCGVGVGVGFGGGLGLGSWYIPENSAFEESKTKNNGVVAIVKRILSPSATKSA